MNSRMSSRKQHWAAALGTSADRKGSWHPVFYGAAIEAYGIGARDDPIPQARKKVRLLNNLGAMKLN
jgi:hypothetical protein